jgi:hypothetical protein
MCISTLNGRYGDFSPAETAAPTPAVRREPRPQLVRRRRERDRRAVRLRPHRVRVLKLERHRRRRLLCARASGRVSL